MSRGLFQQYNRYTYAHTGLLLATFCWVLLWFRVLSADGDQFWENFSLNPSFFSSGVQTLTIYYFIHFCMWIYICRLELLSYIILLLPYNNVRLLSVLAPFTRYHSIPSKIIILYVSTTTNNLAIELVYHTAKTFNLEEPPPILFNKNKKYSLSPNT